MILMVLVITTNIDNDIVGDDIHYNNDDITMTVMS